ncbi:MAG: Swt1 family HEPN domain-containing protein [Chitinophagaceae bacterium]
MRELYNFVYRGILTEESLDKAGRKKLSKFGKEEEHSIMKALSFEMLDDDNIQKARLMSLVYIALHSFENSVRDLVKSAMAERFLETWWEKVPEKIKAKVKTRQEDDIKFRWHGSRGTEEIMYCEFGDLSSIIVVNWDLFKDILTDMEWAKGVLSTLERSRNIIMHGGIVTREDIERIGINIRAWVRQTG